MRPKFGAVFRLYEAGTGRRIKELDELAEGKAYVAAGQGALLLHVVFKNE